MRGAERPGKVQWTHPFLQPLQPLGQEAAQQTFIDIADGFHDRDEMDQVLLLTDNIPLVINLIAHVVDTEGCTSVLSRWEKGKTAIVSEGYDQRSSLDLSISLSLSSPRMMSVHQTKELLSLLSMLPDGLSDAELQWIKLPVNDILRCRSTLLRTSLAYINTQNRLKVLIPIQEYMLKYHPAPSNFIDPVLNYVLNLLEVYKIQSGTMENSQIIAKIVSNLANIHHILLYALQKDHQDATRTVLCILYLNTFHLLTGQGRTSLMAHIPNILPWQTDPRLEVAYITQCLESWGSHPIANVQILVDKGLKLLSHCDDTDDVKREFTFQMCFC
jgi:hypothetical protein